MKDLKTSMAKDPLPDQNELVVLILGSGSVSVLCAAIRMVTKFVNIIDVSNFWRGRQRVTGLAEWAS
jgi:hypothetical protein